MDKASGFSKNIPRNGFFKATFNL